MSYSLSAKVSSLPIAGEKFMRYLMSTTLVAGITESAIQVDNPTISLPTSSATPIVSRPRCITTFTHDSSKILP